MIKSNFQYRYLLLFIIIKIKFISGQICQNDIPDFFYNVNFAGPIFDQPVYTILSNFSVATPNNTEVLTFYVRNQTIYTRPSFISTTASGRALNIPPDNITVISSDPDFTVRSLNGRYALVTNTFPLKYFLPFHRYLFKLIASQTFSDRPPVTSSAIVQINLTNDNVHDPNFIPNNQTFYISETAQPGTQFGTVYATDDDNDNIRYSISDTQFYIEPLTGVLRLERRFDSSSQSDYIVTVTATDDASSCSSHPPCDERSKSIDIRIIVTAVNKNSPQFLRQICGNNISVYENNIIGRNITSLVVLDSDRGDNGRINISFPSEQLRTTVSGLRNTAYSQFYIEQLEQTNSTRTAILKTNETFDYDKPGATRVWYLFILATDNGKPRRQTFCSLRINLLDLNDNAPVFIMTSWNYTIYNSSINTNNIRFLRIIAYDADSGLNGLIDYYIGTVDVPYFSINRTTGTITLRSDISGIASLNISRFPITFYVYAQDRGAPPLLSTNNATVTIYYNSSGGLPPAKWLDTRYEELDITISEKFYETNTNQLIYDNNQGFNGSIFYELTSQTSSIMTVSSPFIDNNNIPFSDVSVVRNGQVFMSGITVISGLHAEIQNVYLLYIRVLVNPPLIGSIKIRLEDKNDQIPTFDIRSIVLSVVEKEEGNRTIAQIQAFDRDIDYNNSYIEYRLNEQLSDNEVIGNFHVESDGTIWTNKIFGGENNKTFYRLFITAYNIVPAWNLAINNTQDFQFDVQVISINDKRPVFNDELLSVIILINETTINGTTIRSLMITDSDIDTNLNLGILSGNLRNAFTFTLSSTNLDDSTRTQYEAMGELKVVGPLDYELTPEYTLVLFAFDTKNIATINVTVRLQPQNTKAPWFELMPGFNAYQYRVLEETPYAMLNDPRIQAVDPDNPNSNLHYEIYDTNHQLNLYNISLNEIGDYIAIGINPSNISRDLPFGNSLYNFSIKVTDEGGSGVSSYVPVIIEVIDINNKAPIPTKFPCIEQGINSTIQITFEDYDDPKANNTIPYRIEVLSPLNFKRIGPTITFNGSNDFVYNDVLNRTLQKYLTVTFNARDSKDFNENTTISIIVCDKLNTYPISDGSKTIKVIYVNGYQNSLINVNLGSIYVNDLNDWFRDNRTYTIRPVSNQPIFNATGGLLSTSEVLNPGFYTVHVDVTKPFASPLTALSTIDLEVESVDSEYVRQASTIRIQGEYPETLINLTLGYPLNKILDALASCLSVSINSIKILAIRPVFQYRSPYYPPKSFELDKDTTLTDVIFYVLGSDKYQIESELNRKLDLFQSLSQIKAVASGPNPCNNYVCPIGTRCQPTRTIQPKPCAIDANQTSFVGINILDSADCVNATYTVNIIDRPNECMTSTFNNLTYCSNTALLSYGPIGSCCEILGRTFDENGGGYAIYAGTRFSFFAPARFSFDFVVPSPIPDGLILLYGRNSQPVDDFFWIAIEIFQSRLRFRFRDRILDANQTELNPSTWYHVECQFVSSIILVSVNDCQYDLRSVNDTLNTYNLSAVELYLGGFMPNSLVSALYPSLTSVNKFNGCIRNVLSNGYYLDMSKNVSSANSNYGECPCSVTQSCIASQRVMDIIVPWYTWLIIALVFLLLATIFTMILLTFVRKRQQLKTLARLYTDDTKDNIIDYKETAGEEDHSTYNLHVLKKPVYSLTDDNIIRNNGRLDYNDPRIYYRPSLSDYIEQKLSEQVTSYANDTQLHYQYEGQGSITSDLSSIESSSLRDENDYRFLSSLGPKFSRLADLYAGHTDNT